MPGSGRDDVAMSSQGEEDVVKRGPMQGDVCRFDAGLGEQAQGVPEGLRSAGGGQHDAVPLAVMSCGQRLQDGQRRIDVLGRDVEGHNGAAGALLEFGGGALRKQPPMVDDGDAVREVVGLIQVLVGEQDGGAGGGQLARGPAARDRGGWPGRRRWSVRRGTAPGVGR
jgi:hypothetical protein